ncbi:hypothetical protein Terro_1005 [Terriglobus roseus DSM 18391]|uniref:DUF4350 domain-containing protein n=1 Tax=Terriglobus roseus (strain DSM 18391 / NRRL B-41598 / KBS 63) TaxID=926566 RepID=I3ZDK8_TERRK|nr:DUF4350 domain-containing protein [Terriglobus roseus]AFL87326.1 hypothetical protein Terro_1005 [Terriglobus roseus DSM 18391]
MSGNADRRIVLWLLAAVVVVVGLTAFVAPVTHDDDPKPTTYNSGTHGAKGAYLLLGDLGYEVSRSDVAAAAALDEADAPHTTYILAEPRGPSESEQKLQYGAVERFLQRGGRVLATGFRGAYFLPGGRTGAATQFLGELCTTVPEGAGVLAQVGSVSTYDATPWNAPEPAVRVDQRCGSDAVVVHRPYANGGEMVWWSSAEALTNRGIAQDNSLRLLLLSVGPAKGAGARRVIFDEFYHGEQASAVDYLKGLPLRSLAVQVGLVVVLLLFSYSRRSGPIREPLVVPRTSPIEFARNMGALYERAGVTEPATEAARRRLVQFLVSGCGLTQAAATADAHAVATSVGDRFGIDPQPLQKVLERADAARYDKLRPRDALVLVQAVDREIVRLRAALPASANHSFGKLTNQVETT